MVSYIWFDELVEVGFHARMPWYAAALQMSKSVPAITTLFTTVSCVAKDGAREEDGDLGGDERRGDVRALRRRTLSTTQFNALAGSDGLSMNWSLDSRPGSFVLHDALSSLASSPGKRVNGSAFLSPDRPRPRWD